MAGVGEGVVVVGSGEVAVATVTDQSSERRGSARSSVLQAAAAAANNAGVDSPSTGKEQSGELSISSTAGRDLTCTSTSAPHKDSKSAVTQAKQAGDTGPSQPVNCRSDHTPLNSPAGGKPTKTDCAVQHGEEASRISSSSLQPLLLPKVVDLAENGSDASAGSSSIVSLPLPPVPTDMAEAIKRQQKGAGNVRYWKTKHLQSGRNQAVPLSKSGAGGFQSAMLPALKPPCFQGPGSGVAVNGNAAPRLSKARERLLRQRGKENGLAEIRRSIQNLNSIHPSSSQASAYHTQYMYGHALGDYPPPPAAYKRSVAALESLLSLPLPASLTHPAPHKLTPPSSLNPQLTHPTQPNPALTLTPQLAAAQGLGRLPRDGSGGLGVLGSDAEGRRVVKEQADLPAVAELTCLQLADAILGTRSSDLSQYYHICQTKIRYVDFLERSATFRALEPTPLAPKPTHPPKAQPAPLLLQSTPRLHTWVPGLDLENTHLHSEVTTSDPSPRHKDAGDPRKEGKPPVTLPSLVAPSCGAGMRMTHGVPAPSVGKGFLSFCNDTDTSSAVTSPRSVLPASSSAPIPCSLSTTTHTGKPILKPFNPDAIPVKIQRPYDPFSPRSVYSDLTGTPCPAPLSVRGTTMYPMASGEGGRAELPGEVACRRSQSSKSRKEAELRKRAVRFSISDQVYEFAPGEPLLP